MRTYDLVLCQSPDGIAAIYSAFLPLCRLAHGRNTYGVLLHNA